MKFRISENEMKKNQIALFIYETTYLLILHVNEGNEWPENPFFGPSDPSPTAFTDPQKTTNKTSESAPTWAAIWPIQIGRKLDKLYTKIQEIFRSIRIWR